MKLEADYKPGIKVMDKNLGAINDSIDKLVSIKLGIRISRALQSHCPGYQGYVASRTLLAGNLARSIQSVMLGATL